MMSSCENNNNQTTKTYINLEDPSPIIEVPINVKSFSCLHIHTRNFYGRQCCFKVDYKTDY